MKITVVGAGYVGLVSAACFAELGNDVICVEKMASRLENLKKGESPIYEPGLEEVLKKNIAAKRIRFASEISADSLHGEMVFICVGTPQSESGHADLSQVEEVARQIAAVTDGYRLIVEKSTVPVNTHQWVKKSLKRYARPGAQFDVASNPEFLREGSALEDFMKPDRIVVGVESDRARALFSELYRPFTEQGYRLIITNPAAAELIKHAANSFLAMKISYINMVADLCEKVDADIEEVSAGIGLDKRIGKSFLRAGIGYGGSCFPKDVRAFIKIGENHGVDFGLLRETEKINERRRRHFINKLESILWINKDKEVAVWGLAFKPDTDDIREAPALSIIQELLETGASLRLYDPKAMHEFSRKFPESKHLVYSKDAYDAVKGADALLVLTEWKEFIKADFTRVKESMRFPIVLDGRNCLDQDGLRALGIEYHAIGREKFSADSLLAE